MVALLVRLRWRQLGHQLSRSPWYIVALVLSGLTAMSMIGSLALGISVLRVTAPDLATAILVIIGTVITAGWWIGALFISADDSLAPERFSLLPLTARRLLPGLVVAGATGIGGIGTALALLLMLLGWSVSLWALLVALVSAPIALAICVLGSRTVSGLLARWLAKRRTRDLVATIGVLVISCSGLLVNALTTAMARVGSPDEAFSGIAEVLAWTPLGAAFGAPAAAAEGRWGVAVLRLIIALATVALLWLLSERMLATRLVSPISESGGGRVRSGGFVDRLLPATPTGAIASRTLRYQRRDPRHLINLVMLLVLPAAMLGIIVMNGTQDGGLVLSPPFMLVPSINALLLGTIVQMSIAYDNDAVALHAYSGVTGAADRAGRLLGIWILVAPITVVLCAISCAVVGRWDLLPASLGSALGLSLAASGAGSLVGVYLPGRAPAPGANPLGRGSSGGVQSLLAMLAMIPVTVVIGAPALGFAIASLWTPWLGWASLGAGLLLGGVAVWGGILLGGRALDHRWPRIIAEVSSES